VRDRRKGREVELTSYKGLQEPHQVDEGLLKSVLLGLSCRRYRDCSEAIPEAFSLSPSTVSRRFIRASPPNRAKSLAPNAYIIPHDYILSRA